MQRLRITAAVVGWAAVVALGWILTEGASLASASTRYRSGGVARTQLVGHYGRGTAGPTAFVSMGADLMAGVVAILLVAALAFMVVTFIRRRTVTTA